MAQRRVFRSFLLLTLFAFLLSTVPMKPALAEAPNSARPRPNIPGGDTYELPHFIIHYAIGGRDGVDATDSNADGVPDYVALMGETLEYVWDVEINQMGFAEPIPDYGEGGDTRLDVYIQDVMGEGYAGYVDTGEGYIGDNPNTAEKERNAAYGYMVLDNDYAEMIGDPSGETPTDLLQVTAAHEFNHLVQASYDDYDPHTWLYEATSTWMEDAVYDDVNDGVWYLDSLTNSPDTCLVTEGLVHSNDDDGHWYSTWLFLRSITEQYGDDIPRIIWENNRRLSGFDAIDAAMAPLGSSLINESHKFVVNNLLRNYEEGAEYPVIILEGTAGMGEFFPTDGVQSLASDTVKLNVTGLVNISLSRTRSPMTLQVVGVSGGNADVYVSSGAGVTVDAGSYDSLFAIVHNDSKVAYDNDCTFDSYSLVVSAAGTTASAPAYAASAANFIDPAGGFVPVQTIDEAPPNGAPVRDEEEVDNFAESATDLPVGFMAIEPAYLPEGYSFDYAYVMTADEFGDSAAYYTPSGEDSANMDYLDSQGNWLSIAESPSPYATIQAWLDGIAYDSPGQIVQISGVDVLIEDLSDAEDIWFSATMILDNLFIVVDGDSRRAEVEILVEGLIAAASGTESTHVPSGGSDVAFAPIEPGILPSGYSFDSSYVMAASEFGDNELFYSPSGEDTINFDYYNESSDWLSIAESPSPYASLDAWMNDVGYDSPGALQNISGVDVLVEDLGTPDDPWHSATLITNGLFIVIDGDSRSSDVVELAGALIGSPVQTTTQQSGSGGLNFSPIEPAALPAGYTLMDSYTLTAGDFGQDADFYTPSGELTYNYDYETASGSWLSIAESPSPYNTLGDWLSGIGYDSPGSFQDISGTQVLVEDLSNEEGPWYSVTMILNGLFIVVDSDTSQADAITLTEGLIAAAGASVYPSGSSQPADPITFSDESDDPLGGLFDAANIALLAGGCGCIAFGMIIAIAVVLIMVRNKRKKEVANLL